ARAARATVPFATVLRRLPVHRPRGQVREARGHGRLLRARGRRRIRPAAGAGVLHGGRHRRSHGAGQAPGGDLMRVTLISPDRSVYDGDATAVVVPAYDGLVGVLPARSEEHTSELQSRSDLVCR